MNDSVRSDQYVHVDRGCPIKADVHPVDDFMEVTFGDYRFSGSSLHLVIDNPDMLLRLIETLNEGHVRFTEHMQHKVRAHPAMSNGTTAPHASTVR